MDRLDFMMISTELKLGLKISILVQFIQFLSQVLLRMDRIKPGKVILMEIKIKIIQNLSAMILLL